MNTLPQPNELVFAYGTLKRGGEYQWVMDKADGVWIGDGKLSTPYPLVLDRYPCLLDQPGKGFHVKGEIYRIPESSGWEPLDWLENHPDEYLRRIEEVRIGNSVVHAWTYFFLRPELLNGNLLPVDEYIIHDAGIGFNPLQ